jgi:hypothetical protein
MAQPVLHDGQQPTIRSSPGTSAGPAGWQQWLTSVPGRELLAPATGAPNVQIWVCNAVIVIKPASMQLGGTVRGRSALGTYIS